MMAADAAPPNGQIEPPPAHPRLRVALSLGVVALIVAYSIGVVSGVIIEARKIDATHLALLVVAAVVVAALLRPDWLKLLRRIRIAEFELELEQVRAKQDAQQRQIRDIRMILPLLIPEPEQKHLANLASRATAGYVGSHTLRAELRRLRSIGLIRMKHGHRVGDIKSDQTVDLAEYVELTPAGATWVRRLEELDDGDLGLEGAPAA